jgi:hypothetical protein
MGVNSKNSQSDDYQLKETRQDELGKTFVYDRLEDNIDRISESNETHIYAKAKNASASWVSTWVWISLLILSVTIVARTNFKITINIKPLNPSPLESPQSPP